MVAGVAAGMLWAAKPPWERKKEAPQSWTATDAEQILNDSPWAQPAEATLPDTREERPVPVQALPGPAQAGLPNPKAGATDGRWDGGVSANKTGGPLPTLTVLVRWESAAVVKLAHARLKALGQDAGPDLPPDAVNDYVLTVVGLVPAKNYKAAGKLSGKSSSDERGESEAGATERLLENFMSNSTLMNREGASVKPHNIQIDPGTGTVRLYFPRSLDIQAKDKDAYLATRYGSLTVHKRFHLSELLYKGKLEL